MNLDVIWAYVLVFLLSALPFVEGVLLAPIAILAGLSTVPVIILAIVGNLLTVYIVVLFIDQLRRWFRKDRAKDNSGKRAERAQKLWNKFGIGGLSLIGPFIVGSHLTAFLGLIFGGTKRNVTIWMTISITAWCIVLAILAHFGISFVNVENSLIDRYFQSN